MSVTLSLSKRDAPSIVTTVTARLLLYAYLLLIEQRGETKMTTAISTKFATLALAAMLLLPGALATLNQAAQIVA